MKRTKETQVVRMADFIDVQGWKSLGNRLHDWKLVSVRELHEPFVPVPAEKVVKKWAGFSRAKKNGSAAAGGNGKLKPGDTIELF